MALEFIDSFDHYNNSYLLNKWTSADVSTGFGIDAGRGRFGTQGYQAGGARQLYKTLPGGAKAERIVGFAFQPRDGFGAREVISFTTAADPNNHQVELRLDGGVFKAYRGAAAALLATGTSTLLIGAFYYVEFRCLIHNSAGEVEVRVNGTVEFNVSGLDTQATADASSDGIVFGSQVGGGGNMWLDDVYVLDMVDSGVSGAPNNDFLNDVRVDALMPNANGTTSNFDGSDGNQVDNYLLVDEIPPDDDTTYVESGDAADKDTYNFDPLASAAGTVYGIQACPFARKTDSGVRSFRVVTRESGGTEEDGSALTLGTSYGYFFDVREADPDGNQWTVSSINSMEAGPKVVA